MLATGTSTPRSVPVIGVNNDNQLPLRAEREEPGITKIGDKNLIQGRNRNPISLGELTSIVSYWKHYIRLVQDLIK